MQMSARNMLALLACRLFENAYFRIARHSGGIRWPEMIGRLIAMLAISAEVAEHHHIAGHIAVGEEQSSVVG